MIRKSISEEERREIFRNDDYTCQACGDHRQYKNLEVDHIIPVSRGGSNDYDNLHTLCRDCNRLKSDLTMNEFMEEYSQEDTEGLTTVGGGLGGAIIGFALGGPPGALVGGVLGLIFGAVVEEE